MARGLKFRSKVVEELYYPYSENKGADLRLCFHIYAKSQFSHNEAHIQCLVNVHEATVNRLLPWTN